MVDSITSAEAYRRPSLRFLFSHPAHFIAFGFGTGLAPFAPGTFGTALAVPMYVLLAPRLGNGEFLLLLAGMFIVGAWACEVSGRKLGVHDHGGMVWDEVTAFLAVLFFTPATILWQIWAFLLFRLFDIFKPVPIRYFDHTIRNGLGVMLDDLLAAFYALLCLAGWKFLFG